jgi:hypothetical protein
MEPSGISNWGVSVVTSTSWSISSLIFFVDVWIADGNVCPLVENAMKEAFPLGSTSCVSQENTNTNERMSVLNLRFFIRWRVVFKQ